MPDEVTRETIVPAERERVWEGLTEPGFLGDQVEVDLRPGGDLRTEEREGFVEEVEPGERLSFWWGAPDEESTRVEVTLADDDRGTLVRVVETRPLDLVPTWAGGPQALALA